MEIGTSDGPRFYINGKEQHGTSATFAGFSMEISSPQKERMIYTVVLDGQTCLVIRDTKGKLRVKISGATSENFSSSVGLMGSFPTGIGYARDGVTIPDTINKLGVEWQVNQDLDGLLFQTPSPFPDKCEVPGEAVKNLRRRRLSESSVSYKEAELACFRHQGKDDF